MRTPIQWRKLLLIIGLAGVHLGASAQNDPEFPKGFILFAKVNSGMVTDFTSHPDLFAGGIELAPQVTLVPHLLRAGIIGGGFFANNRIEGELGPTLSLKLKTFYANLNQAQIGSVGNLNLLIDHLWSTGKHKLVGGGLLVDVGNFLSVGLTAHRDYQYNTWWFRTEIGIRISKKKKNPVI